MKLSIIGIGSIGTAVATNLSTSKHEIFLANRTFEKAQRLADSLGQNVKAVSIEEAIEQGEVLLLSLWSIDQMSLINQYYEKLAYKTIIDPSNPIAFDSKGIMRRTLPENSSSGEVIRSMLPKTTNYIKAFGTLSATSLAAESYIEPSIVLYYVTSSKKSDQVAEELIHDSGYSPMNAAIPNQDSTSYLEVGGALHQMGGLNNEVLTKELAKTKLTEFMQSVQPSLTILQGFLAGAFSTDTLPTVVEQFVEEKAEYISLNFDNPELKKIEPWAGTNFGKEAFVSNFTGVLSQWDLTSFEPQIQIEQDGFALVYGKFSLKSKTLKKETYSPMAAIAHVTNGKIDKFIYLEDTFATAYTFKKSGSLVFSTLLGEEDFTV